MLRIKAVKTSLYKLTTEFMAAPRMRNVQFSKIAGARSYRLKWYDDENGLFFTSILQVCAGRPIIQITGKNWDGQEEFYEAYPLTVEDLMERGMIEKVEK